jgi:glycosyltransferase involved in cell wall biosynthesis
MAYISVIVPSLNEERYIGNLFKSLNLQNYHDFETIVVDGGSTDATVNLSHEFGATTITLPKVKEFPSRNKAAELSNGEILLFTGADVVFPKNLLANIAKKFEDPELTAVGGPGIPYDTALMFKTEFFLYNCARCFFALLPKPLKRFSTSTNLLAVRKDVFLRLGGLDVNDVNADGMLGRKLCGAGKVWFSFFKVKAYASARRIDSMGGATFNMHFAYVLENFFPFLSETAYIKNIKNKSGNNHSNMRKLDAPV